MYAIVEIAGQQFKVEKDQKIYVHRLDAKEGDKVTFNNVLLTDDEGKINVGTPNVLGAEVVAKVLSHMRADKIKVFKKKRRKGYQKLNGHRQDMSNIEIQSISLNGKKVVAKKEVKKAEPKKEVAKPVTKKVEEKKEVVKKETPKKTTKTSTKKGDDLKKVEGIGPKIAEHFNNAGIYTFEDLANTEVSKLEEILLAAGPRYRMHNPASWPKQARMAADGKWDELKKWQDEHDGGKEN